MLNSQYLRYILLILALTVGLQSVDIRIERTWVIAGEAESFLAAICLNVPPGECCKPPTRYPDVSTNVLFRRLLTWDIAAVWRNDNQIDRSIDASNTGCSGPLIASKKGPGVWLWRQPPISSVDSHAAEGASYIRLPQNLPPEAGIISYLVMQGLLGLVWSSGSWFSSPAAAKLLGGRSEIMSGGIVRRDIRSAATGDVYARPPFRIRYPDIMEINGTRYSAEHAGGLLYSDGKGIVLNLTDWFISAIH